MEYLGRALRVYEIWFDLTKEVSTEEDRQRLEKLMPNASPRNPRFSSSANKL